MHCILLKCFLFTLQDLHRAFLFGSITMVNQIDDFIILTILAHLDVVLTGDHILVFEYMILIEHIYHLEGSCIIILIFSFDAYTLACQHIYRSVNSKYSLDRSSSVTQLGLLINMKILFVLMLRS